jgi:hypothetical protein
LSSKFVVKTKKSHQSKTKVVKICRQNLSKSPKSQKVKKVAKVKKVDKVKKVARVKKVAKVKNVAKVKKSC